MVDSRLICAIEQESLGLTSRACWIVAAGLGEHIGDYATPAVALNDLSNFLKQPLPDSCFILNITKRRNSSLRFYVMPKLQSHFFTPH
jgi:hypothetical protein